MKERNITFYRMAKETGISESLFGAWKKTNVKSLFRKSGVDCRFSGMFHRLTPGPDG